MIVPGTRTGTDTRNGDTRTGSRRHFWQRFTGDQQPEGRDLAALRRGTDREPGTVPAMWPYYSTLTDDGRMTYDLRAEHVALALFAVHQQSRPQLMHQEGTRLGTAVLALKRSDRFSADAVDRRFAATATASSLTELAVHLRGLVTQLRVIGQPLDYTLLTRDLRNWQIPELAPAVRRRWGAQYFAPAAAATVAPPAAGDTDALTHD